MSCTEFTLAFELLRNGPHQISKISFVSPSTSWKDKGKSTLSSAECSYFLSLFLLAEWNLGEERGPALGQPWAQL